MRENIQKCINEWDPLSLIKLGMSSDEYGGLAYELYAWYVKNSHVDNDDVALKVYELLEEWAGESEPLKLESFSWSQRLRNALQSDSKNDV